ncbi:MAG: hypothetical protein K2I75_06110, partial [Clostridiales bacterium]|nr:hypothetical protein [Clostridiales bacterium]
FKALAGDSSDNIPGVAGIGEKSAVELIRTYGTLDGVYANLDEIKGSRHDKLAAGKDNALLSYKLARIDTDAPIDFSLSDCELTFPFPAAVKNRFAELEFKSLINRDELFVQADGNEPAPTVNKIETVTLNNPAELENLVTGVYPDGTIALLLAPDGLHIAFDYTDYFAPIADTLMSTFTLPACIDILKPALSARKIITFDLKSLLHAIAPVMPTEADDVALMGYLLEYRLSPTTAAELFTLYDECSVELAARGVTPLYRDIELPLLYVLYDMESKGFAVDRKRLDEIDVKFSELERANIARIRELCNTDINLNSPKQLAKLLFEDMGIPYPDKASKTYSTKAEILQKLSGDYEIVDEILKYRFNSKLKSTFIDGVRKALSPSGKVHTRFNQTLTTTGRLSSTDPNL